MSHYRTNLDDLFFQLFDVEGIEGPEADAYRDALTELDRFSREVLAASFSDNSDLPELVDGEVKLGAGIATGWSKLREAGWDRWGLPERFGGYDVPGPVRWAGIELMVGANPALHFYAGGSAMAEVIGREGTPEQWERYGRRIVEDGWGATMVLTEPDAGSDVGAGRTSARLGADGLWRISGVKRFITSGDQDHSDNIVHLVLARPAGARPGTKGLSLFLVPKYRLNPDGSVGPRNGVTVRNLEHKLGIRHSATAELGFGESTEAVGELLGEVHDGIRQMFEVIKAARMLIGVKATATLSTAHLNALDYARERIQGRPLGAPRDSAPVAIIEHPDVRRLLIDQKATAEGLRSLYLYMARCAEADDAGRRRADLLAPVLKGYASEAGFSGVASALQVLGGSGFLEDYPLAQYLRDSKIDSIYEGTTGVQGLDLVFRKMLGDGGVTLQSLWAEISSWEGPGSTELAAVLSAAEPQLSTLMGLAVEDRGAQKAGLSSVSFLETLGDLVISWLWCRQLAALCDRDDSFAQGKHVAARWFFDAALSRIQARSGRQMADTGILDLPAESF